MRRHDDDRFDKHAVYGGPDASTARERARPTARGTGREEALYPSGYSSIYSKPQHYTCTQIFALSLFRPPTFVRSCEAARARSL